MYVCTYLCFCVAGKDWGIKLPKSLLCASLSVFLFLGKYTIYTLYWYFWGRSSFRLPFLVIDVEYADDDRDDCDLWRQICNGRRVRNSVSSTFSENVHFTWTTQIQKTNSVQTMWRMILDCLLGKNRSLRAYF